MTRPGLALRCRPDGTILEVLHDDLGAALATTQRLEDLFAFESGAAAIGCLEEAATTGAALVWLLLDGPGREQRPARCLAVGDRKAIVIVAATVTAPPVDAERDASDPTASAEQGRAESDRRQLLAELTSMNSELVATHLQLQRKTAALEEVAQRRNELLGMAAHDLRNPLQAVRGFADTLRTRVGGQLDERERLMLDRMVASSDHMLALVHELLTVSELEAGEVRLERELVDVAATVRSAVALIMPTAETKDIRIHVAGTDAPIDAEVDQGKVEQVVMNLVTNAVKFSSPGASVDVEVAANPDHVSINVRDDGPGIAREEVAELFRPFGRTSAKATAGERSTGLGLPIARSIVEHHGGRIAVASEVGVGSTFTVELPRRAPRTAAP